MMFRKLIYILLILPGFSFQVFGENIPKTMTLDSGGSHFVIEQVCWKKGDTLKYQYRILRNGRQLLITGSHGNKISSEDFGVKKQPFVPSLFSGKKVTLIHSIEEIGGVTFIRCNEGTVVFKDGKFFSMKYSETKPVNIILPSHSGDTLNIGYNQEGLFLESKDSRVQTSRRQTQVIPLTSRMED